MFLVVRTSRRWFRKVGLREWERRSLTNILRISASRVICGCLTDATVSGQITPWVLDYRVPADPICPNSCLASVNTKPAIGKSARLNNHQPSTPMRPKSSPPPKPSEKNGDASFARNLELSCPRSQARSRRDWISTSKRS